MRKTSASVGFLLSSMPTLKAINVQLDRIAAMQQTCGKLLPATLAQHVRVSREDGKFVVLEADSGALVAKVRQLTPRLLAGLRQRHGEIAGIRCEVGMRRRTQSGGASPRRMATTGRRAFDELAGSLPAGELRAAVERLLGASDRQNQPLEREESQADPGDQ